VFAFNVGYRNKSALPSRPGRSGVQLHKQFLLVEKAETLCPQRQSQTPRSELTV